MDDYTDKIGDHLNDILENIDAQKGFDRATEHTDSIALQTYFKTRSQESRFCNRAEI